MTTVQAPVCDMMVTVKSREMQRALLAEMRGDRDEAERHFLAAGHLELVLSADYEKAGLQDLAFRSRISAASCFFRGGQAESAKHLFHALMQNHPARSKEIEEIITELEPTKPAPSQLVAFTR